jgi:hypothetical protein
MRAVCRYAKAYADRYNLYNPPKKVDFVKAYLLELVERPNKPVYVHHSPLRSALL